MLTGGRPFRGAHTAALLHALHYTEPRPLGRMRQDLPEALEPLLEKMLGKKPAARFQRMGDVVHELEQLATPAGRGDAAAARREVTRGVGGVAAVTPASTGRRGARRHGFVACERELAALEAWVDEALTGHGRVGFVTGEAGSGKTALTRGAFLRQAGYSRTLAAVADLVEKERPVPGAMKIAGAPSVGPGVDSLRRPEELARTRTTPRSSSAAENCRDGETSTPWAVTRIVVPRRSRRTARSTAPVRRIGRRLRQRSARGRGSPPSLTEKAGASRESSLSPPPTSSGRGARSPILRTSGWQRITSPGTQTSALSTQLTAGDRVLVSSCCCQSSGLFALVTWTAVTCRSYRGPRAPQASARFTSMSFHFP